MLPADVQLAKNTAEQASRKILFSTTRSRRCQHAGVTSPSLVSRCPFAAVAIDFVRGCLAICLLPAKPIWHYRNRTGDLFPDAGVRGDHFKASPPSAQALSIRQASLATASTSNMKLISLGAFGAISLRQYTRLVAKSQMSLTGKFRGRGGGPQMFQWCGA